MFHNVQVPIKSSSEFRKLYFGGCNSTKTVNKLANELPKRSHRGLIIHVTSPVENTDAPPVGKLNFVDLAGLNHAFVEIPMSFGKYKLCFPFDFVFIRI